MAAKPTHDAAFAELVSFFLTEANAQGDKHHRSRISAALLSAAARYNAFTWLQRDPALMPAQSSEEAAEFFAEHYKALFRENLAYLESLAKT
jgi:hypothetical protein